MYNNNLEIVRQSQAFKEKFLDQFPPNYRGAVGHLVCHSLRDANLDPEKALQQLRTNGERCGNRGAWQHINQASDRARSNSDREYRRLKMAYLRVRSK